MKAVFAAGLFLLSIAPASAQELQEDEPVEHDIMQAVRARPFVELGQDAIRFSSEPSLGGHGYMIEVARRDEQWAVGRFVVLTGHPYSGWHEGMAGYVEMKTPDFMSLLRAVDSLLAEGEPVHEVRDGEITVCTDGPGYSTETSLGGRRRALAGQCGINHPNVEVADMMGALIKKSAARWTARIRSNNGQ